MADVLNRPVQWGNWTIEPDGTATYDHKGPWPMADRSVGGLMREIESRIQIEAHVPGQTENPAAANLPPDYPLPHLLALLRQRYQR